METLTKKRALYVDVPFIGFKGGDKNRSNFLYESLCDKYEVDVLLIEDKEYLDEELNLASYKNNTFLIKSKLSSMFLPNAVYGFEKEQLDKFQEILKNSFYDIVFFRFCSCAILAKLTKKSSIFSKIVVDVDMLFSRINKEAWNSNKCLKNRYYLKEYLKTYSFEKSFFQERFLFFYTNDKELEFVKKEYKVKYPQNHMILPNVLKEVSVKRSEIKEKYILFFGVLNSTANEDAYKFMVEEIYPLIKNSLEKERIKIKVVGKNRTSSYDNPPKGVEIVGEVEDLNSYIKNSEFVFLPLRVASGTRTRILEVSRLEVATLTTPIGAEGLNMQNSLYIEDNKISLAKKLLDLIIKKDDISKLAKSAYDFVIKNYIDRVVAKDLYRYITEYKDEINIVHIPRRFTKNSWGGTENVILSLTKSLKSYGVRSEIYTSKILDEKEEESIEGAKVKRFSYFYPYFNLNENRKKELDLVGGNIFSFSMFFALLFKKDIDLIHLHTAKRFGSIGRAICKLRKIPYIITLHGGVYNITNEQKNKSVNKTAFSLEWGKVLGAIFGSRRVYKDAKNIICLNQKEYELMKEKYENVSLFSNSIDTKVFFNREEKNKEKFRFLISGRIDEQKNQILALEAFKSLEDKNLELVLLGNITSEEYFKKIKEYIKTNSLENRVKILTDIKPNSKELIDIYHSCDSLILPSTHEPFGIVVLEAWASKLAVIVSDIAGVQNVMKNRVDGLLFKNNNKKSLINKMQEIIKDREIREKVIRNGFVRVKDFDDEVLVSSLIKVYN